MNSETPKYEIHTWLVGKDRRPVEPPAGKYILDFGLAEICERELASLNSTSREIEAGA